MMLKAPVGEIIKYLDSNVDSKSNIQINDELEIIENWWLY
jgi:hypothetical protein